MSAPHLDRSERTVRLINLVPASMISLTVVLILILSFGGIFIGAVDPFFGFRNHDNDDYTYHERIINVRSLNLGVDRLSYVDSGGSHGGVACTFSRGTVEVAGVGDESEFYLGIFPPAGNQPGRIISVSDDEYTTGVWTIDTSMTPNEIRHKRVLRPRRRLMTAGMGVVGSMYRVPETPGDKLIISFAKLLLGDWIVVPFLILALLVECIAFGALFVIQKSQARLSPSEVL